MRDKMKACQFFAGPGYRVISLCAELKTRQDLTISLVVASIHHTLCSRHQRQTTAYLRFVSAFTSAFISTNVHDRRLSECESKWRVRKGQTHKGARVFGA
ncbi:unnamed protein product [Pylaiella littoralis]